MSRIMISVCMVIWLSTSLFAAEDNTEKSSGSSPVDSRGKSEHSSAAESRRNLSGEHDLFRSGGFSFSFGYRSDNNSVISGGLEQRGSYLHNIDLLVGIDGEGVCGWEGASVLLHAISNNGGGLTRFTGGAQASSNLEASKMTKLYQAWFQQMFLKSRLSVLAGLYDLNSEFYVTNTSLLFLNSSFRAAKEISQTGAYGPSVFPNTAAALRIRLVPSQEWSFQFAALDAVPGRTGDPTAPSISISAADGAFVIGEVAYSWRGDSERRLGFGKYTIGAWFYTAAFDETQAFNATGEMTRSTANNGVYLMAEQQLYTERADRSQGLSAFARLGFANSRINQYNYNVSCGVTYVGLCEDRDADKIGLALTHANSSSYYQQTRWKAGEAFSGGELTLELTYRAQLTPWLVVQPDLQHVVHPGARSDIENATVLGSRIEIGF